MKTINKIILTLTLLVLSFSANAYRESYGQFGGWDSYYLSSQGSELCAARGFFQGNYKVIFHVLKEKGLYYLKLNIENPSWSIPQGESLVYITIFDNDGYKIFYDEGLFSNLTGQVVSQASIFLPEQTGILGKIMQGYTLKIDTGNRVLNFDISNADMNASFIRMADCLVEHFPDEYPNKPRNIIRQAPYTRF